MPDLNLYRVTFMVRLDGNDDQFEQEYDVVARSGQRAVDAARDKALGEPFDMEPDDVDGPMTVSRFTHAELHSCVIVSKAIDIIALRGGDDA